MVGDDSSLGSLVGAVATSSGAFPSAAGRAPDPDSVMEEQALPERTDSPEQPKAKKGVNLRKSLAWDNAFLQVKVRFAFVYQTIYNHCLILSL